MMQILSVAERLLKDSLEKANDRIAVLESELKHGKTPEYMPGCFGLTKREDEFLKLLLACHEPSWDFVVESIWPQSTRKNGINVSRIYLFKVRQKLKPFGIEIASRFSYGPYLTRENKEKLRKMIKEGHHD